MKIGMSTRTSLLEEYIRTAILDYCRTNHVADSLSGHIKTTVLDLSRGSWILGKNEERIQRRLYQRIREEVVDLVCLGYMKKGVDVDEVTYQAANAVRRAAELIWRKEGDNS